MRIFFAGPLTDLRNPDQVKAFYRKLAEVPKKHDIEYFWAFLNGTDPIANPDVPAKEVYHVDKEQLENLHVLLIDDVITTGATLEACGNALLNAGIKKLSIAAIAFAE